MALAILVLAFGLLWVSSNQAIASATLLAKRLGLSNFIVGVVILGFGTSLPELATVVGSALSPHPQMALANAVGSNIINVLLILPLGGLFYAIYLPAIPRRDLVFSILVPVSVASVIYLTNGVTLIWGALFLGLMLFYAFSGLHQSPSAKDNDSPIGINVLKLAISLSLILLGAKLAVNSGIELAQSVGIAEESIALVGFALGTSLPELALIIAAARKKQGEFILGNIIGSNIFNLWGILGVAAIVHPLGGVSMEFKTIDLPLLVASSFWFLSCLKQRTQNRLEVVLLLVICSTWGWVRLV